jgi:hypothetical protein
MEFRASKEKWMFSRIERKLRPEEQLNTNPLMESQPVSQEAAWSSRV